MVEKNPEKDIMLYPKRPLLMDGFGYNTLYMGGMPSIDKDGREIVTLTLKTDEVVRKAYNLGKGKVDENGYWKLTVHKVDLIPMNLFDETNRKWLYIKSFNGTDTDISKRDAELRLQLDYAKRNILLRDSQIVRLAERLELAKNNPAKFLKESMEVHESSIRTVAEAMMKEKERQ